MRISVPTVRHSEGAVLYVVSPQVVASGQSAMDACINPKPQTPNPKPETLNPSPGGRFISRATSLGLSGFQGREPGSGLISLGFRGLGFRGLGV